MASSALLKTPIIRLGGKTRLFPTLLTILEQMAPHLCYCEPFAGGAALLFAKRPSEVEIISDVDQAIYDFYYVMRDPELSSRLQRSLRYTPWSRAELQYCDANWRTTEDVVERVRQWFAVSRMSFTHELQRPSWWAAKGENQAARFAGAVDALELAAQRLRRVQVDNRSFEHILPLYDSPQTLFYLDPPYMLEARIDGSYEHELTEEQHAKLLDLVLRCKGQIILSGYHTALYDEKLAGLPLIEKTRECTIHNSRTHKKSYRTECIWIKAHPYGLFSALGADGFTHFVEQLAPGGAEADERQQNDEALAEMEEHEEETETSIDVDGEQVALRNFEVLWEDVSQRFRDRRTEKEHS